MKKRGKIFSKKGLSEVITSVIMVLLVLIAITIVWVVVKDVLGSGTEQSTIDKINIRLRIEKVVLGENQINITLKRNAGSGEFSAIKFVFTDGINSEIIVLDETLRQLEEKMFSLTLTQLTISNITEISVVPVLTTPSGKKLDGLKNNFVIRTIPPIVEEEDDDDGIGTEQTCEQKGGETCLPSQTCLNWINETERCCSVTCEIPTTPEELSPFGFHESGGLSTYYSDLGVKWNRINAVWGLIQNETNINRGEFDWSSLDSKLNTYSDIDILLTISFLATPIEETGNYVPSSASTPYNLSNYYKFLEELINRYNADVKYWQVENEPKIGISNFSGLQKITYIKIKELCNDCKVLNGGFGYRSIEPGGNALLILQELNGSYIDVLDIHYFGNLTTKPFSFIENFRSKLQETNFEDLPIWMTEMGTYSCKPVNTQTYQSEKDQAYALFTRYVSLISLEIKRISWAWGVVEGYGVPTDNDFWDNTGFIYNGYGDCDLGNGVKKLSYYTYKKMTEKLDGSNWSNIQKINESNGIYVYKFTKNSKPIWVAWNDNLNSVNVTIFGINSNSVNITEAVPNYEYGKNVTNYNTAFYNYTKIVSGNKVVITLEDVPVFVEEN